jgi:hypothetical protein
MYSLFPMPSPPNPRRWLAPALSAITLALAAAVWARAPFANGPAEWQWAWASGGLAAGPALAAAVLALAIAGLAAGPSAGSRGTVPLLAVLGFLFSLALVESQPGGFGRVTGSLASRHSFGYVWDAGLAPPTRELLARWPESTARLDQHSRTHPPGALLAIRGLDFLGRRLPVPEAGAGLRAEAARSLEREVQRARARRRPVPERLPAAGTVALLALLLPALSALTAWPLARLGRAWGLSPEACVFAAALWALVPARSLFTPSLDQALPLLLVGAAALAARGGWARAAGAGVLAGAACAVTYGYLAALPLALLPGVVARSEEPGRRFGLRVEWGKLLAMAAGFLLPWAALAAFGFHPLAALFRSLAEHREIAVLTRDYATWLRWNPYDFALLLGPAALGLALAGIPAIRAAVREGGTRPRMAAAGAVFWALLAFLWVSGSVRGEVGRIWLFFMPFAALLAAWAAERWSGPNGRALALLAQAALVVALAARMVFVV